jgi:hypothetical protein
VRLVTTIELADDGTKEGDGRRSPHGAARGAGTPRSRYGFTPIADRR